MRESKFFDEVIALGRLETERAAVLHALKTRFGPEATMEFKDAINAIRDTDKLSNLIC